MRRRQCHRDGRVWPIGRRWGVRGTSGPWIMGCVVVVGKMQTMQIRQAIPQVRMAHLNWSEFAL